MQALPPIDLKITEATQHWDRLAQYGWLLFFVAFGVGAALLLLAVLLPADRPLALSEARGPRTWLRNLSRQRSRIGAAGLLLLLLLCAISYQTTLDQKRGFVADQSRKHDALMRRLEKAKGKEAALKAQYLYMPEGNSLRYLTLGNTAIAADFTWLTSLQFVATSFRRGQKFEMLSRFYNTMMELQPNWVEAATNAGRVLSAVEVDRYKIEKHFISAHIKNPDDWQIAHEAGLVFVVPPTDPQMMIDYAQRATAWFKTARTRRTLPKNRVAQLDDFIAHLGLEGGYIEEAARTAFLNATNPDNPRIIRDSSACVWVHAHSQMLLDRLREQIAAYKRTTGAFPATLAPNFKRMVAADQWAPPGIDFMPMGHDAYGFPIEYNPATGEVSSKGINAAKAMQTVQIISGQIGMYMGTHGEKPPADLAVLRDFLRAFYKKYPNKLTPPIVESLGADLDPTRCPLGTWNYNPTTGHITLPDFCTVPIIYKNVYTMLDMFDTK